MANRIGHFAGRSRFDAELAEEVRFHFESRVEDLQRTGLSASQAMAEARRTFGSPLRAAEDSRQAWYFSSIEHAVANLRYGVRQARRNPGVAAVVILTLGLGIGANSAVFSAIDAVLLRPLPVPDGERLMRVYQRNPKTPDTFAAPVRLAEWDRLNRSFQAITGFYTEDVAETSGDLPEKLTRALVGPRFLEVWGIAPLVGRDFSREELQQGGPFAVLISEPFWRRRFAADPNIVGRQLRFGGFSPTIVGVMPAAFRYPAGEVDVWGPVVMSPGLEQFRNATWYTVVGRLKAGVSPVQARGDLGLVQSQLGRQYPTSDAELTVDVQPLSEDIAGSLRRSLWVLFGSATLLLLIACVNITGLLLVRTVERSEEIALRTSLGASRRFVVWQLLTETGVLAAAGAMLGLLVAAGAVRAFRLFGGGLPRIDEIRINWRLTLYTMAAAVSVALACGLLPALRATRGDLHRRLRSWRGQVRGTNRVQWALAGMQVSLAVVLLTGAGLLVRSLQEMGRVSPGFDPAGILTFHMSAAWAETNDRARLTTRIDRTLDVLRAIPGVERAATARALPGVPGRFESAITAVGGRAASDPPLVADSRFVAASYFSTLRIPLLAGELCEQTSPVETRSAMVNRSFADTYFRGTSPIGHQLTIATGLPVVATIQGLVADVREQGLHRVPSPTVYWCFSAPEPAPFFLVRTASRPTAFAETVRRKLKEIEPARAVFGLTSLEERLDDAYSEDRLRMVVVVGFAASAILLALVGLYGTLSYLVTSRRREVSVRFALGARRGQIVRRFFMQGFALSAVACAAGLALSVLFARWLSGMLYGVSPTDPLTLGAVTLMVLLGAAVASLVPSIRAALVDPMQALRDD